MGRTSTCGFVFQLSVKEIREGLTAKDAKGEDAKDAEKQLLGALCVCSFAPFAFKVFRPSK
jgi:hypothetical protein